MAKAKKADVEIYTDAGVKEPLSAWAAVIVRKDGRGGISECSGMLRGYAPPDLSEARAIANALHKCQLEKLIEPGELVVVRCDNHVVVGRISGKRKFKKPPSAPLVEAIETIRKLVAEMKCRLRVLHVQGHADLARGDRYSIYNARADLLCCRVLGLNRTKEAEVGLSDYQFEQRSRQIARKPSLGRVRETVAKLSGSA